MARVCPSDVPASPSFCGFASVLLCEIRSDQLILQRSTTVHHSELSTGVRQPCDWLLLSCEQFIPARLLQFVVLGHQQRDMGRTPKSMAVAGQGFSTSHALYRFSLLVCIATEDHHFHPLNERLPLPNYKAVSCLVRVETMMLQLEGSDFGE